MEIGTLDGPKKMLLVGAHPDDPEFACGGSLLRWVSQGAEVHYLICTSGDKGSKDPEMTSERLAAIREPEQMEAARRVGVAEVDFLREPDGEFQASLANRERIARRIRELRPDILITHDPWRRYQIHPDHRAVGFCTLDAMVAARDHLFFPHLIGEGLAPHEVREMLLYGTDDANAWVDISSTFQGKLHALQAHVTQVAHRTDLEDRVRERASQGGESHGLDLAEEFHRIEL